MRLSKPVELDDISQVLAKGACPICAYLKNDQAALLHGGLRSEQVTGFCNFHAWALASVMDRDTISQIFLNALRRESPTEHCSVCDQLFQREVLHIRELLEEMKSRPVLDWMRQQGTFCRLHGDRVRELAPPTLHGVIDEIMKRSTQTLQTELENLLHRTQVGKGIGGGVLGRAAEFLVSQRGINR